MKINVVSLIAACVLTLCCVLTAGLYRIKTMENRRLRAQVNGLRAHNLKLMSEYSELRAKMNKERSQRGEVIYIIDSPVEGKVPISSILPSAP